MKTFTTSSGRTGTTWLEQDAVDQRKHGGVHPDGEREGENSNGRKARRFEAGEGQIKILDHRFLMRCVREPRSDSEICRIGPM